MKTHILIGMLFYSMFSFSQSEQHPFFHPQTQKYQYHFKINNVTNLAEAKMITDPLRDKFQCYPTFNDSADYFQFVSQKEISENELNLLLTQKGYLLIAFSRLVLYNEIIEEEKK